MISFPHALCLEEDLDEGAFELFGPCFEQTVLQFLAYGQKPVRFVARKGLDGIPVAEHAELLPQVFQGRAVVDRRQCVAGVPIWQGSEVRAACLVPLADAEFANRVSEDWLLEQSRPLSAALRMRHNLGIDPLSGRPNGRHLREVLHTSGQSEGFGLGLVAVRLPSATPERLAHATARAGFCLETVAGQPVFSLGAGLFAVIWPEARTEKLLVIAQSVLAWMRREEFRRVHIGLATNNDAAAAGDILEQAWQALQAAEGRGNHALCCYDRLQGAASDALRLVEAGIGERFRRFSRRLARFAVLCCQAEGSGAPGETLATELAGLGPGGAFLGTGRAGEYYLLYPEAGPGEARIIADHLQNLCRRGSAAPRVGMACFPFLDFRRKETVPNARKALWHATFLEPEAVVLFDAVSQNVCGDVFYNEGDLLRAVREYRRGLAIDPGDLNLLNSLGESYARLEQSGKAMACFEKIVALDGEHALALFNLGVASSRQGREERATRYFERALEIFRRGESGEEAYRQGLFDLSLQLGRLYCQQGRYAEALALFEDPDVHAQLEHKGGARGMVCRYLGEAMAGLGRPAEAMVWLQRAVRYNPFDAASFSLLGELYGGQAQDMEIALSFCNQAVDLEPRDSNNWRRLATVQLRNGDAQGALESLKESVRLNRKDTDAFALLAEVYRSLGQAAKAAAVEKKMGRLAP